ncbi:MAG: DUF2339 domain-containing protein [Planctomycetota bacterium]|jgi:uncharacterized membrane protein
MEILILLALLMALVLVVGSIAGIVALVRISLLKSRVDKLNRSMGQLRGQLSRLHGDFHGPREAEPRPLEKILEKKEERERQEVQTSLESEPLPETEPESGPEPETKPEPDEEPTPAHEERGVVSFPPPQPGRSPEFPPVRFKPVDLPEPEPVEPSGAEEEHPAGDRELPVARPLEPAASSPVASPPADPGRKEKDAEWWTNLEQAIGQRWITWAGAVVLILAAGFFVKYAFDHKWLGPTGRVVLGILSGLVSAGAGEYFLRKKMDALGQGLLGLGMAILYVSLYATYGIYGLLPQTIVFAFMVLVTAGGMAVAVLRNTAALSFLAVLGGFLTPLMLQSGEDPRDYLFGYLAILDLGVLAVALFKRWRILEILAFAGTWAFFIGWYHVHYVPESMVPASIWVALFTSIFLTLPNVFHLRNRTPLLGERFVMAVVNAGLSMGLAYTILYESAKTALGLWALALSAAYLVLGSLVRRRIEEDGRAVFALVALSLFFVIASVPIFFDMHVVTILWALQAPVLLYLAYKYDYFPARIAAVLPFLLAAGRVFTIHWPLHGDTAPWDFTPLVNRDFGSGLLVVLSGGAFALVHGFQKARGGDLDRGVKITVGLASALLMLILGHVEVSETLQTSGRAALSPWAASLVWTVGAGSFLAAGWALRSIHSRLSGLLALSVSLVLVISAYSSGMTWEYTILLTGRFLAGCLGIAVIMAYAFTYVRGAERVGDTEKACPGAFVGTALFLLALLTSVDSWQWFAHHDRLVAGRAVLPAIWALCAALYLTAGFRMREMYLRYAGVGALAVGACLCVGAYSYRAEEAHALFANAYFASSAGVLALLFAYGGILFRKRRDLKEEEGKLGELLIGGGITLAATLTSVELWIWLDAEQDLFLARCLLPPLWALTVCIYLGVGKILESDHIRVAGLVPLLTAFILGFMGYLHKRPADATLYFNARFLAALSVVAVIFAFDRAMRRLDGKTPFISTDDLKALFWVGLVSLQVLASAETYEYYRHAVSDPERAVWMSQMALSIVWALFATGLLVFGFWRRIRPVRFFALAQFGVTALKVVIVDMARVEEGFRIVSFFVLGVLMIGASYLYHKVEKRMQAETEKGDDGFRD